MNSTYDWFLGFAVASIGFGPWLLVFYLRTRRAATRATETPKAAHIPKQPCPHRYTDGRRCTKKEGHDGPHLLPAPQARCGAVATVSNGLMTGLVIACERPELHYGPHTGVDDKGRLRLFSFEHRDKGLLSEPLNEVPKPREMSQEEPVVPPTPLPEVALDSVPSENPPSDS